MKRQYFVPSLEKAISILRYLKKHDSRYATLTEISKALNINKSSCFVILQTLSAHYFVNYDEENKKYSLGWAFAELGGMLIETTRYVPLARKYFGKLVRETGFTCCIWQRIAPHRVILLDKIENPGGMRVTLSLGSRIPITVGAMGKCFLAFDEKKKEIGLFV